MRNCWFKAPVVYLIQAITDTHSAMIPVRSLLKIFNAEVMIYREGFRQRSGRA